MKKVRKQKKRFQQKTNAENLRNHRIQSRRSAGGSRKKAESRRKAAAYADHSVDSACSCLSDSGRILRYQRDNPAAYQLKRAQEAFDQKNYTSALDYVNRALQLEDGSEDALLLQGQIYQMMKEDDQAETILLKVIDQNPDCTEAYESLLELYDENGSYEQILALKEKTTNPEILSLFDTYLVETPVIDVKSGTYKEFQEVKLSVKGKSLEIYYTLDGSIPTKKDTLYEDVVSIEKQGKTTLTAVAMDKNGRYSEPVSAQYDIELDVSDVPVVSPDGGRFTEASSVTVTVPEGSYCILYLE